MNDKRMKNQESVEKRKKDLADKEAKKEKAIADLRKAERQHLDLTIKERKDLEEERRTERAQKARETANRILRDARKEEK